MKTWGFARSFINESKEDNSRQIDRLIDAGADDIVFEYEYSKLSSKRPFETLLEMAEAGDTIMALDLYRICSSSHEFCYIVKKIHEEKLRLMVVDGITIDCRGEMHDETTSTYLQLTTALFNLEEFMKCTKAQHSSVGARLQRGRIGRPRLKLEDIPSCFFMYYPMHVEGRLSISQFARQCNLSRPTIYKYIKMVKDTTLKEHLSFNEK